MVLSSNCQGKASTIAQDLLIHNFGFQKIGYFISDNLTPMAGDYSSLLSNKAAPLSNITLEGELFFKDKVLLLVIRSPIMGDGVNAIVKEIDEFADKNGLSRIIYPSSLTKFFFLESQLEFAEKPFFAGQASFVPKDSEMINLETLLREKEEKVYDLMQGSGLAQIFLKKSQKKDKTLIVMQPAAGNVDIPAGKKLAILLQKILFGKVEIEESKLSLPKLYKIHQ